MAYTYTFPKAEFKKVPGHRCTDPALNETFMAVKERSARENHETSDPLSSIREELNCRAKAFRFQIYEIGRLLYQVKKMVPHGEFKPWVETNFELGYRTAHNCMRVYIACMGHPEVVEYFNASCLYLISKPGFPEDLRDALFDGATGPVDVQKKDLVELSMKYRKGEVSIDDYEVQNILKHKRDSTITERLVIELAALLKLIDHRQGRIEKLEQFTPTNSLIRDDDFSEVEDALQEVLEIVRRYRVRIALKKKNLEKQKNEFDA